MSPNHPGTGLRQEDGSLALLSGPFRPFFLVGALWAALATALWLLMLHGAVSLATPYGGLVWHAHEMVYGFGAAIVGGFLLTAVPGWTNRPRLLGNPLAAVCALWIAGRVAMAVSGVVGVPAAAAIDLAFLGVLALRTAGQVAAGRNWRNLPIAAAPFVLLAGNALVHAQALELAATATLGNRLGIAAILMLAAVIGGRIVPAFTRNWLTNTGRGGPWPTPFNRFDGMVLLLTLATFLSWLWAPHAGATAVLAGVAAVAHAVRLARWRGWRVAAEPLVWVLHLGYAWLPVGMALLALSAGRPDLLAVSGALHAFTAGVMATMMLAMMTRATLGHTGRALSAGRGTTAVYLIITGSAATRVAAGLLPGHYGLLLGASGTLWVGAFVLYLAIYAPMLVTRRVAAA